MATDKARLEKEINKRSLFGGLLVGVILAGIAIDQKDKNFLFAFSFIAFVLAVCRIYKCQYCGHDNATVVFSLNNACSKCKVLHIFDWK